MNKKTLYCKNIICSQIDLLIQCIPNQNIIHLLIEFDKQIPKSIQKFKGPRIAKPNFAKEQQNELTVIETVLYCHRD